MNQKQQRRYEVMKVRAGWLAKRLAPQPANPNVRGWGSRPDLAIRSCDEQVRRFEKGV